MTAANEAARAASVYPGMALADARAILPALASRPAEPEADAAALGALAEWCIRYTPWTNVDGDDGLWLDITGCAHLFGGEDVLLADLDRRLGAIGLAHRLGLAETPGAAWAVARYGGSARLADRIVPPGGLRAALSPLPVRGLRLDPETLTTLERLGLRRIGDLYGIPRPALARRFAALSLCAAVVLRLDQALGLRHEPISPRAPAPAYRARLGFAEPVTAPTAIETALGTLLADLCGTLGKDRQGARRLTLAAYRVDGAVARVSVALGRPSRNPAHVARLFKERLAAIDPGFGIELLILSADLTQPLPAAQGSLDPDERDGAEDGVARLVDRLSNRLGARNVTRVQARASHVPERAELHLPALRAAPAWPTLPDDATLRPFRLLERPEPIRVTAEIPDGPPLSFTWRRAVRRVVRAQGPERIAPEWWRDLEGRDHIRDYYQVEDAQGRRYWVFRDGLYQDPGAKGPPAWYIHGLFA